MLYFTVVHITDAVTLTLTADDESLLRIDFGSGSPLNAAEAENHVLSQASGQLQEYFQGRRQTFNLPLQPAGTEFQQQVWHALTHIPYGAVSTYKDIAAAIGRPRASRAVGSACHSNPLPIVIPCHRVIGSGGSLTGYAGGLELKAMLLALERSLTEK